MRTVFVLVLLSTSVQAADTVKTANGVLEGTINPSTGIRMFKGVPFARPPIGDMRWQEPQTPENWTGVRKANQFGPRCPQRPVFGDMNFRSNGMSEDCLYLNVWTPAKSGNAKLPVLVYFFGGGFIAGDGSEPRYDGESIATKGIVTVTVNYRLDIFGFLAHPELTKESPHHASGNYGLLDQYAALIWAKRNIAAFGGDPEKITIGGVGRIDCSKRTNGLSSLEESHRGSNRREWIVHEHGRPSISERRRKRWCEVRRCGRCQLASCPTCDVRRPTLEGNW
jgi:para-nitrobenzyl esterase